MKKTLIMSAVAVALAATSAAALAAGNETNAPVNGPFSGVYIQGGAGMGFLTTPTEKLTVANSSYDNKNYSFAGRVAAGYRYQVNSAVGIGAELGYNYNGKSTYNFTHAGTNYTLAYRDMSVDLLGVLTYNFTPAWSVNAKAGGAYVFQKMTANDNTLGLIAGGKLKNRSKVLPEIAMGVSYNLNQNVAVGVEGTYMFGSKIKQVKLNNGVHAGSITAKSIDKIPSSGTVMATVTYTF